jgi:hypothetical protein
MDTYIGVTGFMSACEVAEVENSLSFSSDLDRGIVFAPAILVSAGTLRGNTNRHSHKFPPIVDLFSILSATRHVEKTRSYIHYCADRTDNLVLDLLALAGIAAKTQLRGFQLNLGELPSGDDLQQFMRLTDARYEIILQLNRCYFYSSGRTRLGASETAALVKSYNRHVHRVLIDLSGGTGQDLDPAQTITLIRTLRDVGCTQHIGIAGGLCADMLDYILPILEEFPDTSIDAEGRVQSKASRIEYVKKAIELYRTARSKALRT